MTSNQYHAIIIGSGAGGSACAYNLAMAGRSVLLLEQGDFLPKDGSTLAVSEVFDRGRFKTAEAWQGPDGEALKVSEFHNVGGKTKWYGAALLRFSPEEFAPDAAFDCPGWPIDYPTLAPFYQQAEQLLAIREFGHEPFLERLIARVRQQDVGWQSRALLLGLRDDILNDPDETRHFDGFASVQDYKADAETALLKPLQTLPNFHLLPWAKVSDLLPATDDNATLAGVRLADGREFCAPQVILAAGALNSPRILADYLAQHPVASFGPQHERLGGALKMHFNSVILAFSWRPVSDQLRKTAIFFHQRYPHGSIQCLGWLDGELLASQLPKWLPAWLSRALGKRAYGFFATTEDGSSPANRVEANDTPRLDYRRPRLPASVKEHGAMIRGFRRALFAAGMLSVVKAMGADCTAHALGSMMAGDNPDQAVVDGNGRVFGFSNLYVADGSVLPRSSRVNPALTIYAWGLRLGQYLAAV